MKAIDTRKICPGYQPIPGYVLEEILGRGGFGEVWRADAPGGLKKAVKFVFGHQEQSRAKRELRSLERIKGVHHPFLLTLERFEIVNDQLVIVTELADGSLEDVFKRHREDGSCGIPRDTLLSHMHDAADALDYLHESYQLQHLDIKPGNLLLVGGHVKVADFGLLKDLADTECSLVGGLTPIYAPPEVFDGKPSLHSDQYSLAVMYQELLTGTRPFAGRTIAQLATQHVHSAPNLQPLPPSDRPIAAKALEKNPERRFPTCKEFIDALRSPRQRATIVQTGTDTTSDEAPDQQVDNLPQLNAPAAYASDTTHHALVIALGGVGAECLRDLRNRVADLKSACPVALHGLLIDTDIGTIQSMRVAESSERVPACQTVHIPLRSPHEYREIGTQKFGSISRRWIYNVPRSRSTQGMRPLGRLALVDHGPEVKRALQTTVEDLEKISGGTALSVYVLGSLSGGTCSGIYIDVVHLLRHLLDDAGLEDTKILSLLATAEMRADPATPIALHDTHAAIIEMKHFLCPGNGYPGDEGAQFESVPAARTPLHDVYLVAASPRSELGPSPSRAIADYVWTDSTGGGDLLAAAREIQDDATDSCLATTSFRSVGVVPLGVSRSLEQRLLVPATVRHLLIRWLGLPSRAREAAGPMADKLIRRCALSYQAFKDATCDLVGSDSQEQLRILADQFSQQQSDDSQGLETESESISRSISQLLHAKCGPEETDLMIESVMSNLIRSMSVALHDQRMDVTTGIEVLKRIIESIGNMKAVEDASPTANNDAPASDDPHRSSDEPDGSLDDSHSLSEESPLELRLLEEVASQVAQQRLERLCERLKILLRRIDAFATNLAMAIVQVTKDQPTESNPWDEMPEPIRIHFEPSLLKLHQLTVSRWLLRPLTDCDQPLPVKELVQDLWDEAMPIVSEIVDRKDVDYNHAESQGVSRSTATPGTRHASESVMNGHESTIMTQTFNPQELGADPSESRPLPVEDAIEAVRPRLLSCGGSQRLILVVGNESDRDRFEPKVRELIPKELTVAMVPDSVPKLIHEAQRIEIDSMLEMLSKLNGGNSQVTGRLLTRTDVQWKQ